MKQPANKRPKLLIRIPKDLKKRLHHSAVAQRRSMTAQVLKFIEDGLSKDSTQKEAA